MKFDVVVGNPPYQENKNSGKDLPIYPKFFDLAERVSSKYTLISPARFLFGAGATNSDWNCKMLNDEHLKVAYFNPNSSDVFPNTGIEGGVAVFLRDATKIYGPIGTFTAFEELKSIMDKVGVSSEHIGDLIYGVTSYTLSKKAYADHPDVATRVGKGSGNQLTSRIFDAAPEIFLDEKCGSEDVRVYGRQDNQRLYKWASRKNLNLPENVDNYKVFVPAANGSRSLGAIGKPVIGNPGEGHTATFISIGNCDSAFEANAILKYLKTKFARAMLGLKKNTQHNKTKHVWSKVPIQDFSCCSDIDWSKSISEIDQQLYEKYGLNDSEIKFIEEKVHPME